MPDYKAPLRDIRFVADELWNYDKHYQQFSGTEEVNVKIGDRPRLIRRNAKKRGLSPFSSHFLEERAA